MLGPQPFTRALQDVTLITKNTKQMRRRRCGDEDAETRWLARWGQESRPHMSSGPKDTGF